MGTLEANSRKLRTVADIWSDCAADTWKVHTQLLPAVGKGSRFGLLAGSFDVDSNYNTWIQAMADASRSGSGNFYYLSSALKAVADTYDGTDATVAQTMESLDKQADDE